MKVTKICDVCNLPIKVNKYGVGSCKNCGWNNDDNATKYPNAINPPNFVSLNEAKINYKNKIKYKPTFERIIELIDRGLDFTIWKIDTKIYQSYKNLEEFKNKVNIDNIPLKELWKNIKFIKYDC